MFASITPERRRWLIVTVIFIITVFSYVDRQVVSILKPILKEEFSLDDKGYALIINLFTICYALMYPVSGWLVDKFSARKIMFWGVITWSLSSIGSGLSRTLVPFAGNDRCGCCIDEDVSLLDLAPTFLDLAGVRPVARYGQQHIRGRRHHRFGNCPTAYCLAGNLLFLACSLHHSRCCGAGGSHYLVASIPRPPEGICPRYGKPGWGSGKECGLHMGPAMA